MGATTMKTVAYDPSKDQEFQKFIEEIEKEIEKESERAQAIICHAYVEDLLKELLKKRLIDFKDKLAESIPFKHLLNLCYITGVITEAEREDIEKLADIRNKFAHKRKIKSFNATDIAKLCNDLRITKPFTIKLTPQEKFIKTAGYYIQILNLKLKYTKKVRFVEEESDELKMLDTLYA